MVMFGLLFGFLFRRRLAAVADRLGIPVVMVDAVDGSAPTLVAVQWEAIVDWTAPNPEATFGFGKVLVEIPTGVVYLPDEETYEEMLDAFAMAARRERRADPYLWTLYGTPRDALKGLEAHL
jgi:hypothetical protein